MSGQADTPKSVAVDDFTVRCIDHPLFSAWLRFCGALAAAHASGFSGRLVRGNASSKTEIGGAPENCYNQVRDGPSS